MQRDIDRLRADNVDTMSLQNQRTALQQQEAALQEQYNELVATMAKMPPEMIKPVT